ncbi:transketolase [Actinopolyspora halophila]|uniref:transketolase n=1 Tax=Actinopolyspora halophila TaxID=1850 RepID=UPI000371675B|nr:transketolase [Actinopolyspora halophila]
MSYATNEAEDAVDVRKSDIAAFAHRMRHHVIDMGEAQGQGYVGQALGVSDILATVYRDRLRFRPEQPQWPERDRFLLSIGHYAIALYAALAEAGVLDVEELDTYATDGSRLPMSAMATYTPGMEISGGSLGHGMPLAVGMALGLRKRGSRALVYNFLSDGELNEGATWEAAMSAAHYELGNLVAVVDLNALQADGATDSVLRADPLVDKWESFGWRAVRVDGNDLSQLLRGFESLDRDESSRPRILLCDTTVGKGVPLLENREKAHFMRVDEHEWQIAREQLEGSVES